MRSKQNRLHRRTPVNDWGGDARSALAVPLASQAKLGLLHDFSGKPHDALSGMSRENPPGLLMGVTDWSSGMPQDNRAARGNHAAEFVERGTKQWSPLDDQSGDTRIGKRNRIGAAGNVLRDRLPPLTSDRANRAGIEVPRLGIPPLAAHIEDKFRGISNGSSNGISNGSSLISSNGCRHDFQLRWWCHGGAQGLSGRATSPGCANILPAANSFTIDRVSRPIRVLLFP